MIFVLTRSYDSTIYSSILFSFRSIRVFFSFFFRNGTRNEEKRGPKNTQCDIKLNSSEVKYISVYNIVGVSYPIISSALLAVTGRAACIGRPVVRLWYPLCHWSLFMVGADCSAESWTSFSEEERERESFKRIIQVLYRACATVAVCM